MKKLKKFLFGITFIIIDYIPLAIENYKVVPPPLWYMIDITERFEQNLPFDKNKSPIVTMGCSFTFGDGIEQKDTLAYKLQKISKRKVYNY